MPKNTPTPTTPDEGAASEYDVEVRFGYPVLEAGFTAVPNLFLLHYANLGIEDAEAMFLVHLFKFKWTKEDPFPRRDRLPMACHEDTRRTYTRNLRRQGLIFTHRVYHTAQTAPTPDLVGKQARMQYDLQPLFYNLLLVKDWLAAGKPREGFLVTLPFETVYKVATGHLQDVPVPLAEQCERHLGISDDAVQLLRRLARWPSDRVPVPRLVERAGMRAARAEVALEHLVEARLIVVEEGQARLLREEELAGADLPLMPLSTGANPHSSPGGANPPPSPGVGNPHPSTRVANAHPSPGVGNDPARPGGGNPPSSPGVRISAGRKAPGRNRPPLKEDTEPKEEAGREKNSSSSLYALLRDFGMQEPARSELVRAGAVPAVAQAWIWFAGLSDMEPSRRAGYVVLRLRAGDPAPDQLLALAQALEALDEDGRAALWQAAHAVRALGRAFPPGLPIAPDHLETYYEVFQAGLVPRPAGARSAAEPEPAEADEAAAGPPQTPRTPEEELWSAALGQIQLQVQPADYQAWVRDTTVVSGAGGRWVIGTPHEFAREWLENRLHGLVRKTLAGLLGDQAVEVEFVVRPAPEAPA